MQKNGNTNKVGMTPQEKNALPKTEDGTPKNFFKLNNWNKKTQHTGLFDSSNQSQEELLKNCQNGIGR